MALAQNQAPDDHIDAVTVATWQSNWTRYLKSLPDEMQRKEVASLSPEELTLLSAAGYQPPKGKPDDAPWWADALNWVGGAVKGAADDTHLSGAFGEVLQWMGAPYRFVTRLERTYLLSQSGSPSWWSDRYGIEGGDSTYSDEGFLGLKGIVRAWRDADNGNHVYNLSSLNYVRDNADPAMYALAKKFADGLSYDDIMASASDEDAAKYVALMQSPDFGEVLDRINDSKVSVGREFARGIGFDAGSQPFTWASGAMDLMNLALDPLMWAGSGVNAYRGARYGLNAADQQARISNLMANNVGVQRYWQGALPHISTLSSETASAAEKGSALRELRANYKALSPQSIDGMVSARVQSYDDLTDHMLNTDGLVNLMQGRAGARMPIMPHRSVIGDYWANLKPTGVVDWLQQGPAIRNAMLRRPGGGYLDDLMNTRNVGGGSTLGESFREGNRTIRGRVAMMSSRFAGQEVKLDQGRLWIEGRAAAGSHEQVYQMASTFAPRVYAEQIAGAYVAADTAGRRAIVNGMLKTIGESAGIPEGTFDNLLAKSETRAYSGVDGNDVVNGAKAAIYPFQAHNFVTMPTFRQLWAASAKINSAGVFVRSSGRDIRIPTPSWFLVPMNSEVVDRFMQQVWRPGVLLRPALPLRNALEEVARDFSQYGLANVWRGRAAARYFRDRADSDVSATSRVLDLPGNLADWFRRSLVDEPLETLARITGRPANQLGTTAAWFASHAATAARMTSLTDEEFRWLGEAAGDPYILSRFSEHIVGTARDAAANGDGLGSVVARGVDQGRIARVRMVPTGEWAERSGDDLAGAYRWSMMLRQRLDDDLGRMALENIDDEPAALAALITRMQNPSAHLRRSLDSMQHFRSLGPAGLAQRIVTDARALVSRRDGTINDEVLDLVRNDPNSLSASRLGEIANEDRPLRTVGQDLIRVGYGDGRWASGVGSAFNFMGDITAYLGRSGITWANYLHARRGLGDFENRLVTERGLSAEDAATEASRRAYEIAQMHTLSYVDNPEIRSQAAVLLRNLFPFYRAQEEFIRRWARTARYSPSSFRKLQLQIEGLTHTGIIQRDDEGHAYFVYPGTEATTELMARVGSHLGLDLAYLPVRAPLRGQVRYLNATSSTGDLMPQAGPFIAFPMGVMSRWFPELKGTEQTVVGDVGSAQNPALSFLPTPIRRALQYFGDYNIDVSETGGSRDSYMASSMRSAITYLEYAGLTPPADADSDTRERYLERVRDWSRAFLGMRWAYSLFSPTPMEQMTSAPEAAEALQGMGIASVSDEFRALVRARGIESAAEIWLKTHPDDGAFTVFQSETVGNGYLPATAEAEQWMDDNRTFVDSYPEMAAYFLPAQTQEGDFNRNVYRRQLASGLRTRKTPWEMYTEVKRAASLGVYYDAKEDYDGKREQLRAAGGKVSVLDAAWQTWRAEYITDNPLVADYLADYGTRTRNRETAVTRMRSLLGSGLMKDSPSWEPLNSLITTWDQRENLLSQYSTSSTKDETMRAAIRATASASMQQIAASDPGALQFYNSTFRYMEDS